MQSLCSQFCITSNKPKMIRRNSYLILLVIFLFSYVSCYNNNDINFEGWLNIRLEHSLIDSPPIQYTERGNVSIQGGTVTVSNIPLSTSDKNKIQQLAKEDKFYRLKAIVINNDGSETAFLTSMKACILARSSLNDYLNINLDHSNNVVGVSLSVQKSITCQGSNVGLERLTKFNTKVDVIPISIGPIPDTASYIQKIEREREAKERGDVKDNRSFLAKYWMYIVPLVIVMVISAATSPEGAAGAE